MYEVGTHYKHYISLGYFCSVAMELEKYGLRDCSYPFDWLITDFEGVILAIESGFSDYLNYENMYQNRDIRSTYTDQKYHFSFIHDFNKYARLSKQISSVRDKYQRRIDRFYQNITEPTLFVRYISDELLDENGKSLELIYIEENLPRILALIKQYNSQNEIMWIANKGVDSDIITIYTVNPDNNDTCCRKPFDNNGELHDFFSTCIYEGREENLARYDTKTKKKSSLLYRARVKVKSRFERLVKREYIHDKEC